MKKQPEEEIWKEMKIEKIIVSEETLERLRKLMQKHNTTEE